jgi:hypothetical protein
LDQFHRPRRGFLILHVIYEAARDADIRHAVSADGRAAMIIFPIFVGSILFSLFVAVAVTWGLARIFALAGRVGPGLLGYVWMEAVLISPGIMIVRSGLSGYAPLWFIMLGGFFPMLALLFAASRVMSVAFGLSHLGFGFLFAVAGSIVAYLVAYLVP